MNTLAPIQGRSRGPWPMPYEALGNPAHPTLWRTAKLLVVDGMGHDLSPVLQPQLAQAVLPHCNALSASSPCIY